MPLDWFHLTADYDLKIARFGCGKTTEVIDLVASTACNLTKGAD